MIKISINGFGRIGRAAFKIALEHPDLEVAAINDLSDSAYLAHILRYDSVFGRFNKKVDFDQNNLIVAGKKYHLCSEREPVKLPWKELGVDVVLECTGVFRTEEQASQHLTAGASRVIISAPAKESNVKTYVIGVNTQDIGQDEKIISCASCTTNCIAPVCYVINKKIGIKKALMTTVHSYTADQNLVDGSHKDLRRARSAAVNIIPTTTGAAQATGQVIPELQGKFDGMALRVPTPNASLADITLLVNRKTNTKEVNDLFKQAAVDELKDILDVTSEPLVSSDLIGNKLSAIVDLSLTQVIVGDLIKIIAWYDNEWGYANRLVELAKKIGK